MAYLVNINKYLLGVIVPVLLIAVGAYFTFFLGGFHILHPIKLLKKLSERKERCAVSPFRALTLALAGTLGVGNIVGVSAAIVLGGFGAVFWMWISAICAMILKYAEVVLAMRHRRPDKNGELHGSAMYYINDTFARIKMPRTARTLAITFAILCLINTVSMGAMIQSNAVRDAVTDSLGISPALLGVLLSVICFAVISKGSNLISRLTEILVPLMSVGYFVLSVAVLVIRRDMIADALYAIVKDALTPKSTSGGILGFLLSDSLRYGSTRGLISNEAGCGTAPMAHSSTTSDSSALQGIYGIIEVFIDTIVLCTMTALVIIINFNEIDTKQSWLRLTFDAYSNTLGNFADIFLTVSVICFGFATILCFGHYGIETVDYFGANDRVRIGFVAIYCVFVALGACFSPEFVWNIADVSIGSMTLINVLVLIMARKEIKNESEIYFCDAKNRSIKKRSKKDKKI